VWREEFEDQDQRDALLDGLAERIVDALHPYPMHRMLAALRERDEARDVAGAAVLEATRFREEYEALRHQSAVAEASLLASEKHNQRLQEQYEALRSDVRRFAGCDDSPEPELLTELAEDYRDSGWPAISRALVTEENHG
jgi:DNA repair exonuclease SbcCD ATPase subunit